MARSVINQGIHLFSSMKKSTSLISTKLIKRSLAKMLSDPENKGVRQDHVNFDTLGTWDNRIDFPMLLQQSIKHGKPIPKITSDKIGFSTNVGRRKYNEDRFV